MKKRLILSGLFLTALTSSALLVGCGEIPATSSSVGDSTTTTEKPGLPTVLPDIEGDKIAIHYFREDSKYTGWDVWGWQEGNEKQPGKGFAFNYIDEYGAATIFSTAGFVLENNIGFIIREGGNSWSNKDPSMDRFFNLKDLKKDANDIYHIYSVSGDAGVYEDGPSSRGGKVLAGKFTSYTKINFQTNVLINGISLYKNDETQPMFDVAINSSIMNYNIELTDTNKDFEVELGNVYYIIAHFVKPDALGKSDSEKASIAITELFKTSKFDDEYNYLGDDLGVTYTKEKTGFKVWSPFSKSMILNVYNSGTPVKVNAEKGDDTVTKYEMTYGDKGVWSKDVEGDLDGKYYTFTVTNSLGTNEVVDPYAVSAGINGVRGMIVDSSTTDPEGWDKVTTPQNTNTETVIYETHVADVTSSESWSGNENSRKKYAGLIEKNTTYKSGDKVLKTGFDHISELGINALHILPIFDQDNNEEDISFNWGYNPLNYNVLEGSYSSNPYDGKVRMKEMKEVVKAYGAEGIKIIMDVVYNHVSNLERSNFNLLLPGYYFRYLNSKPSNGSGCGNETASDNFMFRKFMVDSTKFLAKEYKLGGFRFDLMGLHDVKTMNAITDELVKINPTMSVYGEPWTGGSTPLSGNQSAQGSNLSDLTGTAAFSDNFRNAVKGANGEKDAGWVNSKGGVSSEYASIIKGLRGLGKTTNIKQTINYVSCHDNATLYDKLVLSTADYSPKMTKSDLVLMDAIAATLTFSSQGMTFMQSGEELIREKLDENGKRIENSYNSSYKVNEINYANLANEENAKLTEIYKSLITNKVTNPDFQLTKSADVKLKFTEIVTKNSSVIAYTVGDMAFVVSNLTAKNVKVELGKNYTPVWSSNDSLTGQFSDVTVNGLSLLIAKAA